eukprot:2942011-Amphidinium_carterae.2
MKKIGCNSTVADLSVDRLSSITNRLWFPDLAFTPCGLMGLAVIVANRSSEVSGCPYRGLSNLPIEQNSWLPSGRLRSASRSGLLVIAKVWFLAFTLCVPGVGNLKGGTGTWNAGLYRVDGSSPDG